MCTEICFSKFEKPNRTHPDFFSGLLPGRSGSVETYNPSTGQEISWSNTQKIAHELKHAYQLENKQLHFTKSGNPAYSYDITDEYEAFERQNLFAVTTDQKVVNVQKYVNFNYPELYNKRPYEINVP